MNPDEKTAQVQAFGDKETPCFKYTGRPDGRCMFCRHPHAEHTA